MKEHKARVCTGRAFVPRRDLKPDAGQVRNRRAFDAHDSLVRRRRLVVDLKTYGAKGIRVKFKDTRGA